MSSDKMTVTDIKENDVMKPVAEENDVMVDSNKDRSAEDDAADAKDVMSGKEEVDDRVRSADAKKDDKINVDEEDNGENDVDEMKFPEYDRMNFNWKEVKALYTGQSE